MHRTILPSCSKFNYYIMQHTVTPSLRIIIENYIIGDEMTLKTIVKVTVRIMIEMH